MNIDTILRSIRTNAVGFDTVVFLGEAGGLVTFPAGTPDAGVIFRDERITIFSEDISARTLDPTRVSELKLEGFFDNRPIDIAEIGQSTGLFDPRRSCLVCLGPLSSIGAFSSLSSPKFACIVVLTEVANGRHDDDWRITKELFDAGFVASKETRDENYFISPFIRSDDVSDLNSIGGHKRGLIAMSALGENGRFSNQLFQYAFIYFYGLRHGLEVLTPPWAGTQLFGVSDHWNEDHSLGQLQFFAFDDDDLALWDLDFPPINFDAWGYFQEIPECWRSHRNLLRKRLKLTDDLARPLENWLGDLTENATRPLIAIHVRRGDYISLQHQGLPWYRLVPESWYINWLEEIWPKLANPLLYIATDDPEGVIPKFEKFAPISLANAAVNIRLPEQVIDFEVLRRANFVAIANSSFSRMAGILGENNPVCVLPDFELNRFIPYEPWLDSKFWSKFTDGSQLNKSMGSDIGAVRRRSAAVRVELAAQRVVVNQYKDLHDRLTEVVEYLDQQLAERDHRILSLARLVKPAAPRSAAEQNILNSFSGLARRIALCSIYFAVKLTDKTIGRFSPRVRSSCGHLNDLIKARQLREVIRTLNALFRRTLSIWSTPRP